MPDKIIFSYQGDGDLAAIGTAGDNPCRKQGRELDCVLCKQCHIRHDGWTDGSDNSYLAKTTTTPRGRDVKTSGHPLRVSEMLATIEGVSFIARNSVDSVKIL